MLARLGSMRLNVSKVGSDDSLGKIAHCLYPEGVTEHSPGLVAKQPTLGTQRSTFLRSLKGNRRARGFRFPFRELFLAAAADTQGRLLRSQPWALLRNPVGVNAKTIQSMHNFKTYSSG